MKETILSGNVMTVNSLLNKILETDIIVTSTVVTSLKSYWSEDGSKVIKSEEGSYTIILNHKPKT